MESGERDFTRLPNLYVITILPYDPFGEGYMMYQFRNQCLERLAEARSAGREPGGF